MYVLPFTSVSSERLIIILLCNPVGSRFQVAHHRGQGPVRDWGYRNYGYTFQWYVSQFWRRTPNRKSIVLLQSTMGVSFRQRRR